MTTIDRRSFLAGSLALAAPAAAAQDAQEPEDLSRIGKTPNTRFAVNVEMWWRKLPFLQRIVMAAEYGFPAVEFWPWRGKDINAVSDITTDLGIEVAQFTAWGFVPGMNEPENKMKFIREVKEACEIARRLRCKKMTVVAGNDIAGRSPEQMHAAVIDALKAVAPIAETTDVMLILEPMNVRVDHKGHCLYGSPDAVRICREVGSSHVKINWDLYHMQISEGDLCGRLKDGFDQVGYLQLADHPGRNEPGTGEIHYPRVLRAAKELGYEDFVGLECRPRNGEHAAAVAVNAADQW
ncbi:MAG: TIM barrel protein [Planctomycetota bacterium]|jgi:hydroxypyruvate isomerase|nr:TIM barrel protein [Planctomycetota bacterium]MDP6762463.1 TIM barrel protein [Planctomycetota bacterium]MDP6989279.1 TIM barrel protein [Planctomycetota bacterium]